MTGVLIVWAKLPDEAVDWYENDYLPDMRSQFAQHTLHCEITTTGLEGQKVGVLDAPWPLCAVYEVENAREATAKCYEERNHPPAHLFKNRLADACFDVRTFVELKRWEDEEWDNTDVSIIASVTVVEWAVPVEMQEEVLTWYTGVVVPKLMGSPDVLRLRILEVDNAITQRGSTLGTKDKKTVHTFLTVVEMDSEEWPWDVVIELMEDKNWVKYFENQDVKWSISTYLVKRVYTEADKPRSPG